MVANELKIIFIRILNFIGYRLANFSSYFIERAVCMQNIIAFDPIVEAQYKHDDPNNMLVVTYPLELNSLVVDVGGYTGDWATRLYCLHSCYIDIYEPHPIFSVVAKNTFIYNSKIAVYNFGLSDRNDTIILYGGRKNASLYQNNEGVENSISIRKTSEVFNERYGNQVIDLLKINVEGSEYTILPDLIDNFDMTKIKNILIEFHKNVDGYSDKRKFIQEKLSTTHELVWNYDYIFENWRLKIC